MFIPPRHIIQYMSLIYQRSKCYDMKYGFVPNVEQDPEAILLINASRQTMIIRLDDFFHYSSIGWSYSKDPQSKITSDDKISFL